VQKPSQPDHSNHPLHQILTTWIPSAFYSVIQGAFLHLIVLNSDLFFPPIGKIRCFSRRLISTALETLKFQATPSSELIAPSPAGAQPLLETRVVGEFSLWSTRTSPFKWSRSSSYLCVRINFQKCSFSFSMSTLLPLETLYLILGLAPFSLNFSQTPQASWFLEISTLIIPPGIPISLQAVLVIFCSTGFHPPQLDTLWIVPHLSLSSVPSLALLLPFLITGPHLAG